MVLRIDVARTLIVNLDKAYQVEIAFVPPGLPDDHPLRGRYDDRSISVPASAGSLWMTLVTSEERHFAGAAIFAADEAIVRCDTIEIVGRFRRRGLASCLYELAAIFTKAPIAPGALLSADAIAFWRARLASKAEAGSC